MYTWISICIQKIFKQTKGLQGGTRDDAPPHWSRWVTAAGRAYCATWSSCSVCGGVFRGLPKQMKISAIRSSTSCVCTSELKETFGCHPKHQKCCITWPERASNLALCSAEVRQIWPLKLDLRRTKVLMVKAATGLGESVSLTTPTRNRQLFPPISPPVGEWV